MSRHNKSVSFNIKDEFDVALLTHAEKINPLKGKPRNFSKYVKKLIEDDMNRRHSNNGSLIFNNSMINEVEEYTSEIKNAMNSFL
ncbi:hypothetical protein [Solibacillus sp. CAU 1738]|uniref:hypothetical protein n=1 Tax=Solibacillus sp. CAU 1738 TaxID=3140363 RepID=UPI003260C7DB